MAVKIRGGHMSSADYWRDREAKQRQQNIRDEKEFAKEIEAIYARCMDQCQREIESFYQRYADKEEITLAEAKKRVSQMDIAEYERKAAEYVKTKDFSEQANEEMRLYNATMKINRLEMLKSRIGLEMCGTYSELEKYLGQKMDERSLATFERYAGILGKTVKDPAALAATITNASFHSATWSERLWTSNQEGLRSAIGLQLERGMIRGVSSRELARSVRREFGRSIYETERLMVTELARCQTEAAKLSMEANGNKFYVVLTANAMGPCDECLKMQDETAREPIDVKDMSPGDNAPPLHPSCHCATAPYWDDRKYQEWLDSGAAKAGVPWEEFEKGFARAEREVEYGIPYDENSINADEDYINSQEYRNKFSGITDNQVVNEAICRIARKAILENSGTTLESMYLIDAKTGQIISSIERLEDKHKGYVSYTEEFKNALVTAKEKGIQVISLHNHGGGLPPSPDDFMKAYENAYYKGLAVGHNGQVYSYENQNVKLKSSQCDDIWSLVLQNYRLGYDIDRACKDIYNSFGLDYNILKGGT